MLIHEGVDVQDFYKKISANEEFLGYLPVLDHERHSYHSCENLGSDTSHIRVVPVLGEYSPMLDKDENFRLSDYELYYHYDLSKKAPRKLKKEWECNRDRVLDNIRKKPYFVIFVGCDDSSYCMRFTNKEEALEYLELAENIDDIFDDPDMMTW